MYELLCLQPPPPTLPESLSSTNFPEFHLTFPDDVPFYIRQLIIACLSFDPNKRPSAVDIVNVLTIFIELIDAYHLFSPH
jgi:serine/threonine protein kinase